MKPLIENDWAKRQWEYIVSKVGETEAYNAMQRIPGKRKPYPLNIARVLGIKLPKNLKETPPLAPEQSAARAREIIQRLKAKG